MCFLPNVIVVETWHFDATLDARVLIYMQMYLMALDFKLRLWEKKALQNEISSLIAASTDLQLDMNKQRAHFADTCNL